MTRERFVRSYDGTDLFVTIVGGGEGVPLVLCDGLGCDGFIWRRFRPAFLDRHRIIHAHYRGHGQSKIPEDLATLTVPNLVADLGCILDLLEVERAVLVGHSMGCQVALEYALEHSARTLGVVPICGSYGRPLETFHNSPVLASLMPRLRDIAAEWPRLAQSLWGAALRSELSYQYATRVEVNGQLVSRADFAPYFEHLISMDVRVFTTMATQANSHTVEERLGELECPVLVVAGDRDAFTPFWVSRRMQQLIPGAELLSVPGGTHISPLEIPELLHLRVERFLTERVASEPAVAGKQAAKSGPALVS